MKISEIISELALIIANDGDKEYDNFMITRSHDSVEITEIKY